MHPQADKIHDESRTINSAKGTSAEPNRLSSWAGWEYEGIRTSKYG